MLGSASNGFFRKYSENIDALRSNSKRYFTYDCFFLKLWGLNVAN